MKFYPTYWTTQVRFDLIYTVRSTSGERSGVCYTAAFLGNSAQMLLPQVDHNAMLFFIYILPLRHYQAMENNQANMNDSDFLWGKTLLQ